MSKNIRRTLEDLGVAAISGIIAATVAALAGAVLKVTIIVGVGMFIAVMLFPPDRDD